MQIYVHRYELRRTQAANAVTANQVQYGALIKVMNDEGQFGVADLCPWPELGDLNLEQELQQRGSLFQNSLRLAGIDLEARKNKIKLNTQVPVKNHYTISDYRSADVSRYKNQTVKIKGDQNISDLADFLNQNASQFSGLRLDFNACLNPELFKNFCDKLNSSVVEKIDCVEDPYQENVIADDRIKLASDFVVANLWPLKVMKPSRVQVSSDFSYLTSSMDHPVGVAHGLIEAQKYPNKTHGFLTLDFYEPTQFHSSFHQAGEYLSYQSEGYGIGFDTELSQLKWQLLVDFKVGIQNQIILSSDIGPPERVELTGLKNYFDKNISGQNYLLMPSSGSSKTKDESQKLYAISMKSFLNSAARVNNTYQLNQNLNWGCLLPTYHVGGLSILARAFLSGSNVYFTDWKNFSNHWLKQNNINLISLVPTQLFDLIQKNVSAPTCLKYVFIGGGHLSQALCDKACALGWPVVVTFGMTETSSMFAQRSSGIDIYTPYDQVEVGQDSEDRLKIKSDSLAEYVVQTKQDRIELRPLLQNGWYVSSDTVVIQDGKFKFKHRADEEIKIKGYNVSLLKLREQLGDLVLDRKLNILNYALISIFSERQGEELLLVSDLNDKKVLMGLMEEFNQRALSHEKIHKFFILNEAMPRTELNKIKYAEVKQQVMEEFRG